MYLPCYRCAPVWHLWFSNIGSCPRFLFRVSLVSAPGVCVQSAQTFKLPRSANTREPIRASTLEPIRLFYFTGLTSWAKNLFVSVRLLMIWGHRWHLEFTSSHFLAHSRLQRNIAAYRRVGGGQNAPGEYLYIVHVRLPGWGVSATQDNYYSLRRGDIMFMYTWTRGSSDGDAGFKNRQVRRWQEVACLRESVLASSRNGNRAAAPDRGRAAALAAKK